MADARVSAVEVREIIDTDVSDAVLKGNFIDTAHILVEEHLANLSGSCSLSEAILKKIEMYLAAHFLTLSADGGAAGNVKYTKLGDASESYDTGTLGDGLRGTRYGQAAIMLDTCGILAGIASTALKAEFRVV